MEPSATAPVDVDWNREWERAWKPHPANVWFRHQAAVLGAHMRGVENGGGWVLKTDAFEEACGVPSPAEVDGRLILMDVSPRIVVSAARALAGIRAKGCATDVRRLGFRPGAFAAVLSHSTLDHFRREEDIALALREIHAVLRPGGRLVVTLDNPENPVLAVRRAVYAVAGRVGGVIPFAMGRTLSRRALVAALGRAGFTTIESAYVLHTPRIVALWLAEWAARAHLGRLGRVLEGAFRMLERVLGGLPTRRWTAHFIVAECRAAPESRPSPEAR